MPRLISIALALSAFFIGAELLGLHSVFSRFEQKGNLPEGYYWAFTGLLALGFVAWGLFWQRSRAPRLRAALLGIASGYVVALLLFSTWMAAQFGGVRSWLESWSRLGAGMTASNVLVTPVVLLGPLCGGILFLFFAALMGRREQSPGRSSDVAS